MKASTPTSFKNHLFALAALLFFIGAAGLLLIQKQPTISSESAGKPEPGRVLVFFSNPEDPKSSSLRGGPDEGLAQAIRLADTSVDLAAYRLDLWSIRDALLAAKRQGVLVRVVIEGENAQAPEVIALENAGIPVVSDSHPALMHDKFVIIDGEQVWTGSMNFTLNGVYRNNNNLLRFESRKLAIAFENEFDEMFVESRFGALSAMETDAVRLELDDGWLELFFSPDSDVERRLDSLLANAEQEIDLLVFNFTSDLLAERIRDRMNSGVIVRGVFERSQASNTGGEYLKLAAAGAEIRLDTNPDDMHHKVIIIDDRIVVTGSYNFSRAARDENDENLLIISSPALAEEYLIEFSRLFSLAGS